MNEKSPSLLQKWIPRTWLRRTVLWSLSALLAFAALGFLIAPPVARHFAQSELSQLLGRSVEIQSLSFNPFSLKVQADNVTVYEAKGSGQTQPFLSIKHAQVNASWSSITSLDAVVSEAKVEGLKLVIVRHDEAGRYNFSDIVDRLNARPAKPKTSSEPFHFSLNNLQLVQANITFTDEPLQITHRVEHLNIGVPFVSNRPARIETFVAPKLEAIVNGTPLSLKGQVRPFTDHKEADLVLQIKDLNVKQYLGYLPQKLPVTIDQALLNTDIQLLWSEGVGSRPATLSIRGKASLDGVKLSEANAPLLSFEALSVQIKEAQPLAKPASIHIEQIALTQPKLALSRASNGELNLQKLFTHTPAKTTPQKPAQAPVKLQIDQTRVSNATVHWTDAAVRGGFDRTVNGLNASMNNFDLSTGQGAFELKGQIGQMETIAAKGDFALTEGLAHLQVQAEKIPLEAYRPYYQNALKQAALNGQLQAQTDLTVRFKVGAKGEPTGVSLENASAALTAFSLVPTQTKSTKTAPKPIVSVKQLALSGLALDTAKQSLTIADVSSTGASWDVIRQKSGVLNLLDLNGTPSAEKPSATSSNPWTVKVGAVQLASWGARYEDRMAKKTVIVTLSDVAFSAKDLASTRASMTNLDLAAKVNKRGRLNVKGGLDMLPAKGVLDIDINSVDLLAAQPYIDKMYRVLITQGALSAKGRLAFDLSQTGRGQSPKVDYNGRISVANFNSFDQINKADFVRWKNFSLAKLRVQLWPLVFESSQVRLDSFYSRLILSREGKLNLREIAQGDEPAALAQSPSVAPPAASAKNNIRVKIDNIVLNKGNVVYSDHFVKPNYNANLTEVTGQLKRFSSDTSTLADLSLAAKMEGSAPVKIVGQLNPFREDRYLDIKTNVTGIELTGVSTYSEKYVGYGITKGKLSMDLSYQIREKKLEATNNIVLDQLTFGEQVDSPSATKWPVRFVVSLLKDRNGKINLDLPVSGTLDDPQFSIGGVIFNVIANLFSKAVTSPFSLIGSMFGGNTQELSFVAFDAGSETLTPSSIEKLTTISKVLAEKPDLKLEIIGRADLESDAEGLRRFLLESQMRNIKASKMVRQGVAVQAVDSLKIEPAEREALLQELFEAKKSEKPKNAPDFSKQPPPDQIERVLLAHIEISPAQIAALANRRAQTVQNWLASTGKVPTERMFILTSQSAEKTPKEPAPEQVNQGAQKVSENKALGSRVDFSLK